AVDDASKNGHVHFLDWWARSGLAMAFSERAMDLASCNEHIDVLQWWVDRAASAGVDLRWTGLMDDMSVGGSVEALEWLKNSGLSLEWTVNSMNLASANNHVPVLQLWEDSGLECKWDDSGIELARRSQLKNVLNWWIHSGL
ncbi:hypothetical protein DFJ73DRAFT_613856, partial [Zopfochytrium polystomum]